MKGFLHIIEIVIISVLMFVIVFQLAYIPVSGSDWANTKLDLIGNDILYVLDHEGIDWLNTTEANEKISEMVGQNVIYRLEVKNLPKTYVSVGCICNSSELATTADMLSGFDINGRHVSFDISQIDPSQITFPHDRDVIITWDRNLSAYYSSMQNYINSGRGVVEIRTLEEPDIDNVHRDIFGIEWDNTLAFGSSNLYFTETGTESGLYPIYKYFFGIPNSSGYYFQQPYTLENSLVNTKVSAASKLPKAVLSQQSTERPACVVNEYFDNNGRTVWLTNGNNTLEERKVLLKDLVLWAAGYSQTIIPAETVLKPVSVSLYKAETSQFYEPYEVILTLSYIYQ